MTKDLHNYDIIIIGSGAGGGTVAKELASLCSKGAKIALLEWGGLFDKKDNTRQELEMAGKYYFDHGGFLTQQQDLTLGFAKAVGGSSKVFTGTSLKLPDEVVKKWNVPDLTSIDLAPRYEKYFLENNVHFKSRDELNENETLFEQGCKSLGWDCQQFPIATKDCVGLGTCNLGCAASAKQGTAEVQIPKAQSLGVELITFCRVDKIRENEVYATIVPAEHGLAQSKLPVGKHKFRAKKIVISAGAIHSPALLMRSFGSDFLPAIGRYFTCHPALMLAAKHPRKINNLIGHPKSFFVDAFVPSHHVLLETCMYFPFTLAKNLSGFGQDIDNFIRDFNRLQMILALAIDPAERHNHIGIKRDGSPYVSYQFHENTIQGLLAGVRKSAEIFFAAGADSVHAPGADSFLIEKRDKENIATMVKRKNFKLGKVSIAAAHLMGGCRMGEDARTSVVDPWGRLHKQKDVYVADASIFPAAAEINPIMTIMALADRVAETIKKDIL